MEAVVADIEFALDERSADVRVVTDAVAMDDGIYQRKRDRQDSFVATERSTGAGPRESEGSEDARTCSSTKESPAKAFCQCAYYCKEVSQRGKKRRLIHTGERR